MAKGISPSPEVRAKVRASVLRFYEEHPEARKQASRHSKRIHALGLMKPGTFTPERLEKLRVDMKGSRNPMHRDNPKTAEYRQKISLANKGTGKCSRPQPAEMRLRKSLKQRGSGCFWWRGGITPLRHAIRRSYLYRQWRSDVFTRDDFTCFNCGQRGGTHHAHHLVPFVEIMQLYSIATWDDAVACDEMWNINNGITLCVKCHLAYHAKAGRE